MRVREFGDDPEVAVVAGIHGDEPCGPDAVEALLDDPPDFQRPVKFVVANERALERDVRYVDEDLNRAFPGDPDAESHERRLAHRLLAELDGCATLALHSTQSYAHPFALVDTVDHETAGRCARLPVDAVVETADYAEGRLISYPGTVEVECGLQWSEEAAANARELVTAFLAATGVLPEDAGYERHDVPVFRLTGKVSKAPASRHEVFVENFERVEPGVPFASADDTEHVAQEAFYPILMSAEGYEDVFGYAGERIGELSEFEREERQESGGASSTSVRSRSSIQ
ncbi:Succinylglutamate desuccinylase / Aspartoacylase family protein [Haloplanus vescus]|uniref:Succinylglutamate desuccinylase / Aspartoacylase family protein n=1 Tax=Haloplanus vescus TaxID=555874 RepID=A0A1H3YR32_9EURY|nr:succinylglutamate desuccinylase/aspartoacylase family protein [Haloplanus vescus]SEA13641.1 Succinylglutamate desuccinylase / Aspartoacylase family protein [Haloplanus vescus]